MEAEIKKRRRRKGVALPTTWLHIMLIPAIVVVVIYSYLPMGGAVIAFQRYMPNIGLGVSAFWRSEWVGLYNFRRVFNDADFSRAFINTLRIALLKIVIGYVSAITLSLLLNEVRKAGLKKTIQSLIYLPHFLSWIILAGVIREVFSKEGMFNHVIGSAFGIAPKTWLSLNTPFLVILIGTNLWKEIGYSTIIYLAAITSIDPNLYEAAMVDGAGKLKQIWHVTLPGMLPIIVLTGVLNLSGILNAGFDQVFNLYSAPVYKVGDIIDTLTFRKGFMGGDYELGAAIGLFNSVIAFTLIRASHYLAKRFANYEIF